MREKEIYLHLFLSHSIRFFVSIYDFQLTKELKNIFFFLVKKSSRLFYSKKNCDPKVIQRIVNAPLSKRQIDIKTFSSARVGLFKYIKKSSSVKIQ